METVLFGVGRKEAPGQLTPARSLIKGACITWGLVQEGRQPARPKVAGHCGLAWPAACPGFVGQGLRSLQWAAPFYPERLATASPVVPATLDCYG